MGGLEFGFWILDFGFSILDFGFMQSIWMFPNKLYISQQVSTDAMGCPSIGFQAQFGWTTGKTVTTSLPLGGSQVVG